MSWKWLKGACVIGLTALIASACSTSRQTMMRESRDRVATYEQTDSVREQVMVAVHDTVMEVTTITVREAANGDTLRVSTVTDRVRGRSRDAIATQRTKTEVRVDTVYIEKRDSIEIRSRPSGPLKKGSNLVAILKWLFAIVVALIGLKVSPFLWRREKK